MRAGILIGLLLIASPVAAQSSPYAGQQNRAIKALSDEDIAGLLDGAGMGFAQAAELNGIPGPRHVLDLASEIGIDDRQVSIIEEIFTRMQSRARGLGATIVERERRLDTLFATGNATSEEVTRRSVELGTLRGELRAAHLLAHLETAAALEPHQIAAYARLRGYDRPEEAESDGAADHSGHGDHGH